MKIMCYSIQWGKVNRLAWCHSGSWLMHHTPVATCIAMYKAKLIWCLIAGSEGRDNLVAEPYHECYCLHEGKRKGGEGHAFMDYHFFCSKVVNHGCCQAIYSWISEMCLYIVQVGEVSGLIRKEILSNVQLRAINFFSFHKSSWFSVLYFVFF